MREKDRRRKERGEGQDVKRKGYLTGMRERRARGES